MSSARILIVEDEYVVAMDIQITLEKLGYQVIGHTSQAEEAILLTDALGPDLILMDIRLKGSMDGIEAASEIRQRYDIPVVFLTAHGDTGTLQRAESVSPYGFLVKPFDDVQLRASIEIALHQHYYESVLAASERKTRGIITHSSDGILLCNEEGKIIEWNPAMEQITGLKAEEVKGLPIWEVMVRLADPVSANPLVFDQIRSDILNTLSSGEISTAHSIPREDPIWVNGEVSYVETSNFLVKTKDGYMLGTSMRDVTARRKASEEIQVLSQAIRQSANCVVITDPDGRIEFVNRRFTELTGFTMDEVRGNKPSVVKSGIHSEEYYQKLWAVISSGNTWSGEFYNRRKNGTYFWEAAVISPVMNSQGQITHYIAVKEDITSRKQAEDALQQSEALYRTLVETSPDGIVSIDTEGNFLSLNTPLLMSIGIEKLDDLPPDRQNIYGWIAESDREMAREFMQQVIRDDVGYNLEVQVILADGVTQPIAVNASVIRGVSGKPQSILAVLRDITDQKKAEAARQEQLEMLTTLYDMGREITTRLKVDEVHSATKLAAMRMIPADSFFIWWLNPSAGDFTEVYRSPARPEGTAPFIQSESGKKALTAIQNTGRPYHSQSCAESPAQLIVPISIGETVSGVLGVEANGIARFNTEHVHILGMIANQASAAIQNAFLFEQTQLFAITDSLTGAYNMRQFTVILKKEQERADRFEHPLSVILADIDHFKAVNDTYGHMAGDQVLIEYVKLLQSNLRNMDLLARYGGEEFFILLPQTSLEESLAAAERLRIITREMVVVYGEQKIQITASFGVAEYHSRNTTVEGLLKQADQALYRAKNAGRDRVSA